MTKILFSISELTRVSRQRSDDTILQEQKNEDEQIVVRSIFLTLLHVVACLWFATKFFKCSLSSLDLNGIY